MTITVSTTLDPETQTTVPYWSQAGQRFYLRELDPMLGDCYVTLRKVMTMADQRTISRANGVIQDYWSAVNRAKAANEEAPNPSDEYFKALGTVAAIHVTSETNLTTHPLTGEPMPSPADPDFWLHFDTGFPRKIEKAYWTQNAKDRDGEIGEDFTKPASGT